MQATLFLSHEIFSLLKKPTTCPLRLGLRPGG